MRHPANKLPGCYGLYGTYQKRQAIKNKLAESQKHQLAKRSIKESFTSKAVYMFPPSNEFQYLVGYFDKLKDETNKEFLDRLINTRIINLPKSYRKNLSLVKREV